jgi:hypothetical protein
MMMISNSNTALCVAAFVLLAVGIDGCTQRDQTDSKSTSAPASQPIATQPAAAQPAVTAAAQPAATAAADANAQPQNATAVAAATSSAAVASTDGDQAGTKFVVNSLARGSDVLTLKFSLVNDSTDLLQVGNRFGGSGYINNYRDVSGIHLIDTVSKKKYFPLADTEKNCVCSHDVADITPNNRATLWVKFPAPPASVTKISVEAPHFIPLDNVPITQ